MKTFEFDDEELIFLRRSIIRLKNCLKADLSSYLANFDSSAVDGCIYSISILLNLLKKIDS